VIYPTPLIP